MPAQLLARLVDGHGAEPGDTVSIRSLEDGAEGMGYHVNKANPSLAKVSPAWSAARSMLPRATMSFTIKLSPLFNNKSYRSKPL